MQITNYNSTLRCIINCPPPCCLLTPPLLIMLYILDFNRLEQKYLGGKRLEIKVMINNNSMKCDCQLRTMNTPPVTHALNIQPIRINKQCLHLGCTPLLLKNLEQGHRPPPSIWVTRVRPYVKLSMHILTPINIR